MVKVSGPSHKYNQLTRYHLIYTEPESLEKFVFSPVLLSHDLAWRDTFSGLCPLCFRRRRVPSTPIALMADQSTEELKQARSEMKVRQELLKPIQRRQWHKARPQRCLLSMSRRTFLVPEQTRLLPSTTILWPGS
jgi:hypothetical protein